MMDYPARSDRAETHKRQGRGQRQTGTAPSSQPNPRCRAIPRRTRTASLVLAIAALGALTVPPLSAAASPVLPVPTPGLPDGRAYELLTPPDKAGAEDIFATSGHSNDVGVSSSNGDEFLFHTAAAYGTFPAAGENAYVFSRTASGWSAAAAASPTLGVQSFGDVLYGPSEFNRLALSDSAGSTAGAGSVSVLNLLGPPGGPYTTIQSDSGRPSEETTLQGGSVDLHKIILGSRDHALAPGDSGQDPESGALYEWEGGALRLVNVDGQGALLSPCGAVLGLGAGANPGAVSSDGSKVFFTAPDPNGTGAGCWNGATTNPPQLYMRLDDSSTVEISAPSQGVADPSGPRPAAFVGASADGSRVFFISQGELTKDDEGIHDPELYSYDTETSTLSRVSRGESGSAEGDVYNVPAISADGSAVYFTAFGQLTANAPLPSGEEVDLYRYDTKSEATTYIATVNERDYVDTAADRWWALPHGEEIGLDPSANWETTPDGRYLLFATTHDVGGYNSTAASPPDCPDATGAGPPNGHCDEIYRYDSAAPLGEALTCVSCNPSGADPSSNALFARSAYSADNPAGSPPRAISDDGSYVFFDTGEGLVPTDTNEKLDVYEWHEGRVSLISSGRDSSDSFFLDSSADGSNVFFGTHASLVPADTDSAGDLYDARVGGGFPAPSPAAPCEGDACETLTPPPNSPTPATETSPGPGNQLPSFPIQVHKHKKQHHHRRSHRGRRASQHRRAGR